MNAPWMADLYIVWDWMQAAIGFLTNHVWVF